MFYKDPINLKVFVPLKTKLLKSLGKKTSKGVNKIIKNNKLSDFKKMPILLFRVHKLKI